MTRSDTAPPVPARSDVRVAHADLAACTARILAARGLAPDRADAAAAALCHGDLTGVRSHGLANLARIYLPALHSGRIDPAAEPRVLSDLGACLLVDARRALGLWQAGAAVDLAVERARHHGAGLVWVRGATHFGCAGHHAARAAEHGMVGIVAANCGRQRIAPPPGGRRPLLGTNPLAVAAPALPGRPFVLDMSTTAVPTGRVREAARAGRAIPEGWLADDLGRPVTDPAAFDRGEAHLRWLGQGEGAYKGFGLGLAVEVLAALVPGAGLGPWPDPGAGGAAPADDDIGFLAAAFAPAALRAGFADDARTLFAEVLACPPTDPASPVRYPGWPEAERAAEHRRTGVPLAEAVYRELAAAAAAAGTAAPALIGGV
ncbi:Ldh family oxidoreductase [Streptomonospora nanhaiensis]|uniref:LDH2 family malate/lactate/ureidoglycolate dehydrogenase n=1 Tax=Streptomonospora nanhaiensis TaxID=1323731 RepID=A0A853BQJ1_9ACTN|nr:Ldh family oxidoreductase [Streptomonospora nanhaiensis]MBV2366055.1 Ldh family oxidoreductase [Streptomonospora nanhaiensis]NYI97688.1 LDH2 family malate/lactate/ureidoglycolate dehydrogenase [Streptomonospora nanhaiensis]